MEWNLCVPMQMMFILSHLLSVSRALQTDAVQCLSSRTHKESPLGVSLCSRQQTSSVFLLLLCVAGAAWPPLKLVHSFCAMKADDGPCKAIHIRYFFNIKSRRCEVFEYGGCHGNENNFLTLEECQEKCVVKGQYPFSYPPTNSSFASVISHSQTTWIWEVETLFQFLLIQKYNSSNYVPK